MVWQFQVHCKVTQPYTYVGFPGGTVVQNQPGNAEDKGSIPGSGRSPGEGNGNLFQYSCLRKSHGRRSVTVYIQSMRLQRVRHDWVTEHTYTYMYQLSPKPLSHPHAMLPYSIEQSSLCYTVDPSWLSILNTAVRTCQCQGQNILTARKSNSTQTDWSRGRKWETQIARLWFIWIQVLKGLCLFWVLVFLSLQTLMPWWNAGHLSASCRLSFFLFTDLSENTVCPAGCDTRSHYCPHRAWCWSVLALRQENRWDGEGVSNNSSNSWNLSLSMSSPYLEMHPSLYGVILFCIVLIRLEGLNRKKGKK